MNLVADASVLDNPAAMDGLIARPGAPPRERGLAPRGLPRGQAMSLVADASVLDNPAAMEGLIARAGDPLRERWLDQVRRTGACRHPIRLQGVVRHGDQVVY